MSNSLFDSAFFAANRRKLRELHAGDEPIVVTANGLLQRGGDSSYRFQQDANFWYLTGIDESDITLVMDGDKEYLLVPGREHSREAFDGHVDDAALTERSGVPEVIAEETGLTRLIARLKKSGTVATLTAPPAYVEQHGLYTNPARARLIERLRNAVQKLEIEEIGQHLVHLRMIKQAPELQAIQAAIDITVDSLQSITEPAQLKTYRHEYEIEADLSRDFRRRGGSGHSFDPIVAAGKRACTLHNVANQGTLQAGELVVLDVGAEVEHYAADITRTVSLGKPSARQQAVYEAVVAVQEAAKSVLKPGLTLRDFEQQVEKLMAVQLRQLGLITGSDHDDIRRYYPHATSHHLGLNVHDAADYTMPLAAGMVITVEPGIYVPEEAIGVRIEDDVLITESGINVLSKRLPRQLA